MFIHFLIDSSRPLWDKIKTSVHRHRHDLAEIARNNPLYLFSRQGKCLYPLLDCLSNRLVKMKKLRPRQVKARLLP